MSKVTRLVGCVAATWLLGVGVASAASITLDGFSLAFTGTGGNSNAFQIDTADIAGSVSSKSNLKYTTDWVEFHVTPTSVTSTTVDVLANPKNSLPSFAGETFQVTSGTTTGPVAFGPTGVTNTPVPIALTGGVEYFLELNSTAVNGSIGQSQFQLAVAAPLPGAMLLFGSVFGVGGLLMRRRNKRAALAVA
jgi:hypothetical protein